MNTKDKVEITYSDRALMLRLPALLLRARGTLTPPDNWPEGATLGSAWRLEAICAGISALATDPPQPVDAAGAGVLLPVAGGGDLCPVMGVDDLLPAAGVGDLHADDLRSVLLGGGSTSDPDVSLASPRVTITSSPPAPR